MKSKIDTGEETNSRGVSPVIGVILMVAITVILAAVIAAFVLDLGSTSQNPQAGFSINEDSDGVTGIQLTTIDRLDELRINDDCTVDTSGAWESETGYYKLENPSVGDVAEITDPANCDRSDDLVIIGVYDGNEAVLN
ncbi:type IV pilin [Natronosalvus hydrolyticus]